MSKPLACILLAMFLGIAPLATAQSKGCIKGAIAGGIAGHYAGHHALLGAAAGCLAGRHLAKKDAEAAQHNSTEQTVKHY